MSEVRAPRGAVLLAGQSVPFLEWEVENNAFFEADTAHVVLPTKALPKGYEAGWLSRQTSIEIEIKAGFPADPASFTSAELTSLFLGRVDLSSYDPGQGLVTLKARDLTQDLIDAKTSNRFANMTASQLAERLASAHGLIPVVTATHTRIGSFYQIDQVRTQHRRSEWDLLTWAAREEDFTVHVRGRELVFGPRPSEADPYVLKWRGDGAYPETEAVNLRFDRTQALSGEFKVVVRSWNHRQGQRIIKNAGSAAEGAREYAYSIPGLTPEQAQARATQIASELSAHEMRVSFDGPADNDLSLARAIEVRGTDTAFDQIYFPDSIRRSLSRGEGYRWSVEAKNKSRAA
jgi:phage protein D